jgi:hypothetical protein
MRACLVMIHAVLASLVVASGCRDVPRESSDSPKRAVTVAAPATPPPAESSVPDRTIDDAVPTRPPPPPPPPPPIVSAVPPPPSIRAAFEAGNDRSEVWTATAYDLVPTKARDRRPRFVTLTIKRTMTVPSTRVDELVHWLSTDAGYVNSVYGCCPVADATSPMGLRLMRGPVVLDFVIECGRIALGAPPTFEGPTAAQGTLAVEVILFLESLHKGPCSH